MLTLVSIAAGLKHNLQSCCDLINPTAGVMLGRRGKYRPTGEERLGTKEERRIIPVPAHTNNKDNTGIYDLGKGWVKKKWMTFFIKRVSVRKMA